MWLNPDWKPVLDKLEIRYFFYMNSTKTWPKSGINSLLRRNMQEGALTSFILFDFILIYPYRIFAAYEQNWRPKFNHACNII